MNMAQTLALFFALNLLFSLVSACGECGSGTSGPNPNPNPKPNPKPSTPYPGSPSTSGGSPSCPSDALKLGVCANVLDLINLKVGNPPKEPCCPLIQGLIDAEAAICLCTSIKANILGINLNIPLSLSLLVNFCGRDLPRGFQCPY